MRVRRVGEGRDGQECGGFGLLVPLGGIGLGLRIRDMDPRCDEELNCGNGE